MGRFLYVTLFAVLALMIWYQLYVFDHEYVHELIFESFGCRNVTVYVGLWHGYTTCEKCDPQVAQCVTLAHEIHESISHNMLFLVLWITILWLITLLLKLEGWLK